MTEEEDDPRDRDREMETNDPQCLPLTAADERRSVRKRG